MNLALYSAASGMESYTVLKDLCGLEGEEIDRITRSNLLAILRAAPRSEPLRWSSSSAATNSPVAPKLAAPAHPSAARCACA